MKKNLKLAFLFCAFLMVSGLCHASEGTLLDDFSSGNLDKTKWVLRDYAREIIDGKLILKLGNGSQMGAEVLPGIFRTSLPFIGSNDIHTIQADITIVDAELDEKASDTESSAMIWGFFYNVNETEGLTGDVFAEINIGERGNGLEAFWKVFKRLSDDSSQWENLGSGNISLATPLQKGTPVSIKLAYDGNKSFEFSVNGNTSHFVGLEDRKRNPEEIFTALRVGINATEGSNTGFISAEFDNVYINNEAIVYDDFSSQLIDTAKWTSTEIVRECSKGYLRSNIRGIGSTTQNNTKLIESDTTYIEAKVRIDSDSQLSDGAWGIGRIQGYYYNDSRGPGSEQDYNKYEGDVFAQVRLRYDSDGSMSANAYVERCNDADQNSFTTMLSHTFSTPIALDTDYNLSISYSENTLVLGCEGETVEYQIATPSYTPYGEHRLLRSKVYLDSDETGFLKVQYDDIFIDGLDNPSGFSVLTDSSPITVSGGATTQIYGCAGANNITIETGAGATLINMPGNNTITIQANSSLFTVSRSGAYVIFEGTDSTVLKIPATLDSQTIVFDDGSWSLVIDSGKVMLENQEISLTPSTIN